MSLFGSLGGAERWRTASGENRFFFVFFDLSEKGLESCRDHPESCLASEKAQDIIKNGCRGFFIGCILAFLGDGFYASPMQ